MIPFKTNYSYINSIDFPVDVNRNRNAVEDKYKSFDKEYYNSFLEKEEYANAADYAEHFINTLHGEDRINARNTIKNMRRVAKRNAALYGSLSPNSKEYKQMKFNDAIYNNNVANLKDNEYADKFIENFNKLGSTKDKNATTLQFTFYPEKQKLFYIDELKQDNKLHSFESFLDNSGWTKEYLLMNGVDVGKTSDGRDYIKFNKTNPLAIKIIKNMTPPITGEDAYLENTTLGEDILNRFHKFLDTAYNNFARTDVYKFAPLLTAFDENGEEIKYRNIARDASKFFNGLFENLTGGLWSSINDVLTGDVSNRLDHDDPYQEDNAYILANMQIAMKDAEKMKNNVMEKNGTLNQQYTSTIGPSLMLNVPTLLKKLESGLIDEKRYNVLKKEREDWLLSLTRSLGTSNYTFYSNLSNEGGVTDEHLEEMDQKHKSAIIQLVSNADIKDLDFNAMVVDGEVGTCITVRGNYSDDTIKMLKGIKNIKLNGIESGGEYKGRLTVFVPSLFAEYAQSLINRDTNTRAAQELADMKVYGYDYDCSDGTKIKTDKNGGYYIDGNLIDRNYAHRLISKDMFIEDAKDNLKYKFMNKNGKLFDMHNYESLLQKSVIRAVNELYPDVPFMLSDGTPLNIEDIFALRSPNNYTVDPKYIDVLQEDLYYKLSDLFSIYGDILEDAKLYK